MQKEGQEAKDLLYFSILLLPGPTQCHHSGLLWSPAPSTHTDRRPCLLAVLYSLVLSGPATLPKSVVRSLAHLGVSPTRLSCMQYRTSVACISAGRLSVSEVTSPGHKWVVANAALQEDMEGPGLTMGSAETVAFLGAPPVGGSTGFTVQSYRETTSHM